MARDTGIAARIRAQGVRVVEVAGWQTRGSTSFSPRGSVNHHTAGGSKGTCPSLNTVVYGRGDLAGPLCNVLQSREANGNDIAYVVAAGRANHAGSGGWQGLSGNSSVYGLEIEHTGTAPLSVARQRIASRIHAAMLNGKSASLVCQHYEWAPKRKIDAATHVSAATFRNYVVEAQKGGGASTSPPTTQPEDDDVAVLIKGDKSAAWWCTDLSTKWHVKTVPIANVMIILGAKHGANNQPHTIPQAAVDAIPRSDA